MYILGFDIGGTKCAVVTALWDGETINISKKYRKIFERTPKKQLYINTKRF